ncbi:MAG: hypothetical protein HGA19_17040, partial [Oscillochloris sp.]|nr:hypothetical protein [Oscillochloris sp.]
MMNKLRQWFNRIPTANPVQQQQAEIFQAVLFGWIVLSTLGFSPNLLMFFWPRTDVQPAPEPPPSGLTLPPWMVLMGVCIIWITPFIALIYLRRGNFNRAVIIAITGLLGGHSIVSFVLGIEQSTMLIMYEIPIILAGFLGGRRLLLIVSSYSMFIVTLVGIVHSDEFVAIGFFIAVTMLSTLLLDRFGGVLRTALLESLQREAELGDIRASLELTVTHRTQELQSALGDVQLRAEQQANLLNEIEAQRGIIRDLSVPVIPVDERTLVIPLVGAMDTARLRDVQEQSLKAIEKIAAHTIVLDVTWLSIMGTPV